MINLLKTLVVVIVAAVGLLFLLLENPDEFKSELAASLFVLRQLLLLFDLQKILLQLEKTLSITCQLH